ncbi:MAG: OadG family protein [Clostridiales bacterium]|nr:OadG family protein [Clostridiales bacterium]
MNLFLLVVSTENFTFFDGCVVAAAGILTVILILFIISVCISVSARIIYFFEHKGEKEILRKKAAQPEVHAPAAPVPEPTAVSEAPLPLQDDKELVAAITAAIAASMNTSPDRLIVRSFRRPKNWQNEAIQEQIYHSAGFKAGL